jgi:hypothetical protein
MGNDGVAPLAWREESLISGEALQSRDGERVTGEG